MKNVKLICCITALLAISACQTESFRTESFSPPHTGLDRKVELTVAGEVKTSYQPGAGVNIDGTENIAVLYATNDTLKGSLKATPTSPSVYTFTIPGEVEPDEMFYGVMPYSSAVSAITTEQRLFKARIFPVQYPSASSFDPHYDFLSAEGFKVEGEQATISHFKRLVAPLRVNVIGLPAGTKIRTAEMILSQDVSEQNCTGLVGEARVYATDNYRKSAVLTLANPGNSVSAVYPEGLEAVSGEWGVWYVVNPSTLLAGSKLAIRISADSTTFTKEVTLPSSAEIVRNELSQFTVDMSTQDVTTRESVTFDFSNQTFYETLQSATSIELTGSNGKSYTISFNRTKCALQGEDGLPCAVQLSAPTGTGKYMTVPFIKGKNVVCARLFAHLKSANTSSSEDSLVVIKNGNAIAAVNANMCRTKNSTDYLGIKGGIAELNAPKTAFASLSGGQIQGRGGTLGFSAMTLYLEDKATPVYDPNDYLSMFEAGLDIEICGKVYNIETHPKYTAYKMSEITALTPITGAFSANGLVFIDNDSTAAVMKANGHIALGQDAVIIGRYISGKGQPRMAITKTSSYFQISGSLNLLNMQVEHNSTYTFFTSKSGYSSLYCQDCTFLSTDSNGHGFLRYNDTGVGFNEVVVDNSIFTYGHGTGAVYFINNASKKPTETDFAALTTFKITNTVFIPVGGKANSVVTSIINASFKTDNADFILENNSFYGMTATKDKAILVLKSARSVSVKDNVFYAETSLTNDLTHSLVNVSGSVSSSTTISGNWMNKYENGGYTFLWNPADGNYNTSAGPFFDVTGLSNLYMPVKGTVVTTSAGAAYDTKKWKVWTE